MRRLSLLAALACACLPLTACAPHSAYRYTAFTPTARPIAWDGAPAERGELRAEATATHSNIVPKLFAVLHDSGLNLSASTAEGYLGVGVVRGLELGLRATYSNYSWSQPSSVGTMPIPGDPSMWGIGPELKLAFALDDERRMTLGLAANALLYKLPWAEWRWACGSRTCDYVRGASGTDSTPVFSGGLYPSYGLGEGGKLGNVFLLFAVHTAFKNDGFTDTQGSGSTIQTAGLVPLIGGGASMHVGPMRLGATVYAPFADGAGGHQQAGGMVTFGFAGKP